MSWIKLEDGSFAEEANPDPRQLLTADELAQYVERQRKELTMYESEIINLTQRKEKLETEITELEALLQEE